MQLTIRRATDDDADCVAEVVAAAFAPLRSIYRPKPEIASRVAQFTGLSTRIVAELDGRIVATVQFDNHKEHIHVIGLAVLPQFQRLGIARRLLDWIMAQAPALGLSVVVLDTIKETGNVMLFEKLGFHVVQEFATDRFESDRYPQLHETRMKRLDENK